MGQFSIVVGVVIERLVSGGERIQRDDFHGAVVYQFRKKLLFWTGILRWIFQLCQPRIQYSTHPLIRRDRLAGGPEI